MVKTVRTPKKSRKITLTLTLTLFFGAARLSEQDSHSKPCSTPLAHYTGSKSQREFECECEDIFLLHTQKNSVSLSLSVRIFCSFTPKKNRVSVGLSLCASGACEEKAKVKRSYSNSHSLWPLCPLLGDVLTKS